MVEQLHQLHLFDRLTKHKFISLFFTGVSILLKSLPDIQTFYDFGREKGKNIPINIYTLDMLTYIKDDDI